MAETGSGRKVETETNITFGKTVAVCGEAEWAAIQTVQDEDSAALECSCVANAIADQKVSNTHRYAIRFVIDRTTVTPLGTWIEFIPGLEVNATKMVPSGSRARLSVLLRYPARVGREKTVHKADLVRDEETKAKT